jgi:hypothetical protein
MRSPSRDGMKGLAGGRIVDDAERGATALDERDRDGVVRDALQEVGRPVDRIDAPRGIRARAPRRGLGVARHLLADHGAVAQRAQAGNQRRLRGGVRLGEEAAVLLALAAHAPRARQDLGVRDLADRRDQGIDHRQPGATRAST